MRSTGWFELTNGISCMDISTDDDSLEQDRKEMQIQIFFVSILGVLFVAIVTFIALVIFF